jgi:aldose 1-epimerase
MRDALPSASRSRSFLETSGSSSSRSAPGFVCTLGDLGLLDGYGADELATAGHGEVLIPWPNRIEDGAYEFGGEREPDRVVMEHTLHPQPGYPFSLRLGIEYALSDKGLHVTTTATNIGSEACPYGSGMHPYLTVGTQTVDTFLLRAPEQTVLRATERPLPVRTASVQRHRLRLPRPRPIGATKLDNAFTDLERDDGGLARVELRRPDDEAALSLWLDESYPYVQLSRQICCRASTVAASRSSR